MRMRLECSPSPGVACPSADAGKLELFEYVESEGWDNCRIVEARLRPAVEHGILLRRREGGHTCIHSWVA